MHYDDKYRLIHISPKLWYANNVKHTWQYLPFLWRRQFTVQWACSVGVSNSAKCFVNVESHWSHSTQTIHYRSSVVINLFNFLFVVLVTITIVLYSLLLRRSKDDKFSASTVIAFNCIDLSVDQIVNLSLCFKIGALSLVSILTYILSYLPEKSELHKT